MSKILLDPSKIGEVTNVGGSSYAGDRSPKDKRIEKKGSNVRTLSPEEISQRRKGGKKGFRKQPLGLLGKPKKPKSWQ